MLDPPCPAPIADPGPVIWLDDPDDQRLDPYRDLPGASGRTQREAAQHFFVVEGRLAVARLLTSPYRIRSLLVDDHQVGPASDLVEATQAQGAPVYVAPRPVVARTVGFALHRGVVAAADRPPPADPAHVLRAVRTRLRATGAMPRIGVLEGLNDHENIGSLFRNAAAFGLGAILLDPTCADPLYRRSIRVSVGHVLHVPFARVTPWPSGLDQVRSSGFVIAALAPHPATGSGKITADLSELRALGSTRRPPGGVALLLGAEGNGLTPAALATADVVVSIPMAEGVDSLNVATAAAIAFHAIANP